MRLGLSAGRVYSYGVSLLRFHCCGFSLPLVRVGSVLLLVFLGEESVYGFPLGCVSFRMWSYGEELYPRLSSSAVRLCGVCLWIVEKELILRLHHMVPLVSEVAC